MAEICVVHLVRAINGTAPFARFLASLQSHSAGAEHDLLLLCKGFAEKRLPADWIEIAQIHFGAPRVWQTLFVPDKGFDLVPYFFAAQHLEHRLLCFLNSFSEILDDGWLGKLAAGLAQPGIGIAGATGSWESIHSSQRVPMSVMQTVPEIKQASPARKLARALRRRWHLAQLQRRFPQFPNPHLRSNAFFISRELFLRLRLPRIRHKSDAEGCESGRRSLTRQILALGLEPLVVGRDGRGYRKEQWPASRTFRCGEQENLLVADNRTMQYQEADPATRAWLHTLAWRLETCGSDNDDLRAKLPSPL